MATILIVDDESQVRKYLMKVLESGSHRLLQAGDGAEALAAAGAERPDLILSDILMPTMDGYEFVRCLRSDPTLATTPVIFCTATYHEREAKTLAEVCGVQHVLRKPCSPAVLLRIVNQSLGLLPLSPPPVRQATFDQEHLRLLTDKLANKVDELETVTAKLNRLVEVSLQLALEPDPTRLVERYGEAARDILGARHAAIGILAPEGRTFRPFFLSGGNVGKVPSPGLDVDLFRTIFTQQRAVREQNFGEGALAASLPPTHPRQGAFLGVPITSAGKVYGILYVIGKLGAKPFSDEDECLAASLAAQIGSAYRNVLQYEQLKAANTLLEQEVAQRQRAEEELQDSTALLHILSYRLMEAQENERRCLARELHDGIGQAMSTLGLNLHLLKGACSAKVKATCINDSVGIVARTLQQVRDLSLGLRPSVLDDLGLLPALEWQLGMLARSAGIHTEISADPFERRVPPELETACFRVAQEALTNVARHARARSVCLEVRQSDRDLILTVRDDGVGFDVGAAARKARGGSSMGLLSMQERVSLAHGEFNVQSTPGSGTKIRARFPLADLPAPGKATGAAPHEAHSCPPRG